MKRTLSAILFLAVSLTLSAQNENFIATEQISISALAERAGFSVPDSLVFAFTVFAERHGRNLDYFKPAVA